MRRGSQGGVDRIAQGDLHRLVVLVQGIVGHGHGDVFGGVPGNKGQGAGEQSVVGPVTGSRAAGYGIFHGHRLARRGVE